MSETMTLYTLTEDWLKENEGFFSQETIELYRRLMTSLTIPYFGESVSMSEEDVLAFMAAMQEEKGLAAGTAFSLQRLLRKIVSYGAAIGVCESPAWPDKLPQPERNSLDTILTAEEERRAVKYLTNNPGPKHLGIFLILTAGLRIGELLDLTWDDISFHHGTMRVRSERGLKATRKAQYRRIDLDERQKIYLKKLKSHPAVYIASGKPKSATAIGLRGRLSKMVDELLLPEITFMDLRRTYAVHQLESGKDYAAVAKLLGMKNDTNFRAFYRNLVNEDARERLDRQLLEGRKVREAPEHIDHPGPDLSPEVIEMRQKVEAKKKDLQEMIDNLDGDMAIIKTLRNSDCVQGKARNGFYAFVEKVLGPDDKDGKILVEYLRNNMRVADMPSRTGLTVQSIRSRVAHGFDKLISRLDDLYAVEGYDILPAFNTLTAHAIESDPVKHKGPKGKPTPQRSTQKALTAIDNLVAENRELKARIDELKRMLRGDKEGA